MYTKTKLRQVQNVEKFEKIYTKLENVYNKELKPLAKKVKLRKFISITSFVFALISLWIIARIFQRTHASIPIVPSIILLILPFIPILIIGIVPVSKKEWDFSYIFKEKIYSLLVKQIEPHLTYSSRAFKETNIFENYKSSDYDLASDDSTTVTDVIEGSIGNKINTRISNICISRRCGKSRTPIFYGLFCEVPLNKNLNAKIKLLPNYNLRVSTSKGYTKIEMDSTNFENKFDVYSNNKIIALQLLTSTVMEKLNKFYDKYEVNFEFSIINDKLFVRIKDAFLFNSIYLNKKDTFIYYSYILFTLDLLEELYNIVEDSDI